MTRTFLISAVAAAIVTAGPGATAFASAGSMAIQGGGQKLPAGFPTNDNQADSASCYNLLSNSMDDRKQGTGLGQRALGAARDQWEAGLLTEVDRDYAAELIGKSAARIDKVPAAQRDAASLWCVENAPELTPQG